MGIAGTLLLGAIHSQIHSTSAAHFTIFDDLGLNAEVRLLNSSFGRDF